MRSHLGSHSLNLWARWSIGVKVVLAGVAIVSPFSLGSVGRAQQALPPPPAVPNASSFPMGGELPSLAPVPPPMQGVPTLPPASVTPLPQESIYQPNAPVPGMVPGMNTSAGTMPGVKSSHYQVVVPSRPEEFSAIANKMVSMGVRPDAIQAKRAPLGPHLSVGPFIDQREAEGVSQYLRSGGMDARVFFNR